MPKGGIKMPILVCLKEPAINLILDGEIKDDASAEYDKIFPNLMIKDQDGHWVVMPLSVECNIAFIKEVTQADIDEQKKKMEERQKEMHDMRGGRGGPLIKPAQFMFPRGGGKRR